LQIVDGARRPEPGVRDAAVGEIVGPDLVAAVAGPDLRSAHVAALLRLQLLEVLVQLRLEGLPGQVAVARLRALVLALHDDVGRDMRQAHRALGLVDVLAARAAGE